MVQQRSIIELRQEVSSFSEHLKERITTWRNSNVLPAITDVLSELTTLEYGKVQKTANYIEEMVKGVLLLLSSYSDNQIDQLQIQNKKLTLGELVRLVKAEQRHSQFYKEIDKAAVCKAFSLLDNIVVFRNRLVHCALRNKARRTKKDLEDFLEFVYAFCGCAFLSELLRFSAHLPPSELVDGSRAKAASSTVGSKARD